MFPRLKFSLARHGCWSWGKQRSSRQGDKRSCFSTAVWLALMKRFSQQISYCYLITGCQHEIQIADFRWKILSATCQSGQPPIPWKRKTLPLKPKTWRKDIKKFSQGDCCRWWDARLQSPEVSFVRSFLWLYRWGWPVQMETRMGVPFLGSNTAALFSRHLFQGSFYDNRAVACSFTAAISPNPQFHILRFHTKDQYPIINRWVGRFITRPNLPTITVI